MQHYKRGSFRRGFRNILSFTFFTIITVLFFLSSCEDDPSRIGMEFKSVLSQVQPVYVDTFSVYSSVESQDSMQTDHAGYALLGNFMDPVFGWSNASFLTQYRLSDPWNPGHNPDVDSVKLFLKVEDYTGNEVTRQTVNVYELFKNIYFDSLYYSNLDVKDSISEWPVGSATFLPTDSLIVVFLSKTFGRKIMHDTGNLDNQQAFLSHFKGFYVDVNKIAENGNGGFVKINLLAGESYMAIYYHNDVQSGLMFPFYINGYSARVNLFEHHYDEASAASGIRYLNQGLEDSVIYVQGMNGVITKLYIPGIKTFRDSSIIINSARLIIPLSPDDPLASMLKNPEQLILKIKGSHGKYWDIVDRMYYPDFYGGKLDEEKGQYSMGITKHIQEYISGKTEANEFYLMVSDPAYNARRAVLNARLNSNPLKLVIIYSRM